MKKSFRQIDKEDRLYQKDFKRKLKLKQQQEETSNKDCPKSKLALFFQKLFSRKQRSEIVKEIAESEQSERIKSDSDLCSALDNGTSEINSCNTNHEQ